MDFPSSPTLNQLYPATVSPGERQWKWNGVAWDIVSMSMGYTGDGDTIVLSNNPTFDATTGTPPFNVNSTTKVDNLNADKADILATSRTINGTSFNGSADITTSSWGTYRTLTIGSTGKSVDGSGNVSWTLGEIGAAATSHTHTLSDISQSGATTGQYAKWDGSAWVPDTISASGTVTSVGLSLPPSIFTVSGSPVTTSGTLSASLASQDRYSFFAAPTTVGGGTPSFRAIVAEDIPTLNQNTTGSAATLTTARTLTIGATGKSFNGSANVSWTVAEVVGFTPVNKAGDTMTGALTATSLSDGIGDVRLIPQLTKNAAYTVALADGGKHVISTDNTAYAWTIPPNSSVAFPVGTAITFIHDGSSGTKTLTQGSGVTIIKGTTSGDIALAAGDVVTLLKTATNKWRAM